MSPQKLLSLVRYQKKDLFARVIPIFDNIFKTEIGSVVLFSGHVGAGKTFLIKSLLKNYFQINDVNSPTYAYMKKYTSALDGGIKIVHFDLYRLTSFEDFCDLGFWQELFVPNQIILIEWPELLLNFLTEVAKIRKIYLVDISSEGHFLANFRVLKIFELFF